ncbi:MAG: 50S ribosomal protein L1 [Opitutales bacterium]|nr:50S ribosomal protein L1 [Opitutales bacterium]
MKKPSKRYRSAFEAAKHPERFPLVEAVKVLQSMPAAKFDESVELSFHLGVDPRQSNQMVRGTVALPHGSGKEVKVIVFTANADEAKAAGADEAGLEDLIAKVKDGWLDFDVAVATPEAMKEVRTIARTLGPKGLMPNPKSGTVTDDIPAAIKAVKAGRVEFKMDKTGNVAVLVGKRSFSAEQLTENANAILETLAKARPDEIKGRYIVNAAISSTMSPSVRLDPAEFSKL